MPEREVHRIMTTALFYRILQIWQSCLEFRAAGISNPTTNIGEFASVDESELGIADIYFDCNGNYVVEFEDMDELAYACCSVFVNEERMGSFMWDLQRRFIMITKTI